MAIYKSFSYKGKAGSLKEGVGILVQKRAKASLAAYIKRLTNQMRDVALKWQNAVRLQLSVPAPVYDPKKMYAKNTSPFPRTATGKLKLSIKRPEVTVEKLPDSTNTIGNYKVKFTGLFGRRGSNSHYATRDSKPTRLSDVGQYLNDQQGESFAGWKDRAQHNLLEALKRRINNG